MDGEGEGERWGVTGMTIRIIWERGDWWCGMAIGKTAGGPRAEKGGGRRMGGMREVEGGGRRRKYFSTSAGGKGCH